YDFSLDVPIRELSDEVIQTVLYGDKTSKLKVRYEPRAGRVRTYDVAFEGVIPNLRRRYSQTQSDYVREDIERFMSTRPCPVCHGQRLRPEILAVTVNEASIVDVTRMSIHEARDWFDLLAKDPNEDKTSVL